MHPAGVAFVDRPDFPSRIKCVMTLMGRHTARPPRPLDWPDAVEVGSDLHGPYKDGVEERYPTQTPAHRICACFGVRANYFDRVNLSVAKQALERASDLTNVVFGVLLDRFGVQPWVESALSCGVLHASAQHSPQE